MATDIVCVHHAAGFEEAEVIVAWLAEQGITAQIEDEFGPGPLESALPVPPKGIEVWVASGETATRAADLLEQHGEELQQRIAAPPSTGTVDAVCEDCGKSSSFSITRRGQVDTCAHCGAYVDVP